MNNAGSKNKHENYETLNLIGYGLAKFNRAFIKEYGFKTKTAFYQHIVEIGIADTVGTVKNRQDLFDPFFDNGRKGWWQRGDTYLHRKVLIDSLFGTLAAREFVAMLKAHIVEEFGVQPDATYLQLNPITKSRFKQLQLTGRAAELYFMNHYQQIGLFSGAILDDARLYGDGYDFQVQVADQFYLAEVKGVRAASGSVRLTENEHAKATEYKDRYALVVVSNLNQLPKMTAMLNPAHSLALTKQIVTQSQVTYHSEDIQW